MVYYSIAMEYSGKTDEAIAQLVQGGDLEAFGILVERFEERLKRYAKRFLFGYTESEDVVQDVFLKAYTNIQSFDSGRQFSSWIYRIAHNEFINAIKKRGREPLPFFDPDTLFPHPVEPARPDTDIEKAELIRTLEASLSRLDPKYREPLVLYYFEDLDYKTIADIVKVPVSTVGVRILRGRKMLQKTYNSFEHSHEPRTAH